MKILILILSVILFSSIIFSNQSFAVDFVDSTGYTPSWAKGSGYQSVLLKCTELIGDYSRDGDWCMEWVAYVLDQGVENFPESTEKTGSYLNETPVLHPLPALEIGAVRPGKVTVDGIIPKVHHRVFLIDHILGGCGRRKHHT